MIRYLHFRLDPRVCGERSTRGDAIRLIPLLKGTLTKTTNQSRCQESETDPFQKGLHPPHVCGEHRVGRPRVLRDQPRVCGEHSRPSHTPKSISGSSPRVRGTPDLGRQQQVAGRFIPACAGNTAPAPKPRPRRSVHPRVCGEHMLSEQRGAPERGSSPRVRGTRWCANTCAATSRFIPACAGNTQGRPQLCALLPVHPRVCGEHGWVDFLRAGRTGSSPRVRGTPLTANVDGTSGRFIPACAGNTAGGDGPDRGSAVHPRVCGEHR
jgi:hypothetical protein